MNLDAQWVVGFTDGEGCFHVGISNHPEMALGVQVLPEFVVVQHKRDVKVLHAIKAFFGCGVVRVNHGDRMCYRVRNLEHLTQVILPFFQKHPLKTLKQQDYHVFRDVVRKMVNQEHLTPEGLQQIREMTGRLHKSISTQGKVQLSGKPDESD